MKGKAKNNFKSGEVVRLVSGGPDMTVVEYSAMFGESNFPSSTLNWVDCIWFDGKKQQTGKFPPESLQRVKKTEGTAESHSR
jgi:uncharacterized protein YodC (DUF2158 family)